MRLECRFSFDLPKGGTLMVLHNRGEPPAMEVRAGGEDRILVQLPDADDDGLVGGESRRYLDKDAGLEVLEVAEIEVRILTAHELERPDVELVKDVLPAIESEIHPRAIETASRFLRVLRWRTGQFWLPDGFSKIGAIHFYLGEDRVPFGVQYAEATVHGPERALSTDYMATIEGDLIAKTQPPLAESFLLDAHLYRSKGDNRVALILAAISLEATLVKLLRRRLVKADAASASQIDKFLEEMSNRLLSTVVLGLLQIGDQAFRERCRLVFERRNGLAHGKKPSASRKEADDAIATAQTMLDTLGEVEESR